MLNIKSLFENVKNDIDTYIIIRNKKLISEAGFAVSNSDFSVIDSPRQALTKIHQLTGTKLKTFIQDLKDGLDNSSLLIKTTPKIDGHPFRVAWIDDKAYIETSYSGLMGAEEIKNQHIPKHEQQFFDYINKQDKTELFKELKKYGLTGIKILGELLANGDDFADDNGTITYVGTTYDATKLGKYGSVVIIDIKGATLEKLTDLKPEMATKIKNFLAEKFSDKNASYFDINQFAVEVPISKADFSDELISSLNALNTTKTKSTELDDIKLQINAELTKIFKDKFKNPAIMKKDDKSLEGVAFELNGKLYGVHYQSWKDIRTGYYKDIDEIKDFVKLFLAKLTDEKPTTTITSMVSKIRSDLGTYQKKYEKLYTSFLLRRKELTDKLLSNKSLPKFVRSVGQDRARALLAKFKDTDITSDINSFLDATVGPMKDMNGKTIAIIPGSFRPPHKGHFALIQHYAKIADEVIVAVSGQTTVSSQRPDKFGRTMPNYVVGKILKIYCDAYGLKNVKIAMTMKLMQWVSWKIKTMKNVNIMLGVSGKDDAERFSQFTSDRFKKANPDIHILPVEDNQMDAIKNNDEDISATYVRQHIDDKKVLRKVLPSKLSDKQFDEVYELINPPSGNYPPMDDKRTADALFVPESDKTKLTESGNAFDDVVRIDTENVDATIEDFKKSFCKYSKLDEDDIVPLGSTGKRLPGQSSGDLDLGINLTSLQKNGIDIEDKTGWFDFCKKFATEYDVEYYEHKARGLTSVRWPIVDVDDKQSNEFVQIDLIPHKNLKMLQWGMYQTKEVPGQDYDKSAVRALLLQAIVKVGFVKVLKTGNVPSEGAAVPVKLERYEYKQNDGLFKILKERPLKKDNTYGTSWKELSKVKVTDDPQKIIDFIFGNASYAPDNLLSVKEIWDAFVNSKFYKDKDMQSKIRQDFEEKMNRFKFPYPKYIKFTESMNEDNNDSKNRVAVIITDGKDTIVGKAPQQMKKSESCCDLFKGHAEVGEKLEDAAKREVYEEAGITLDKINKITDALKYSKGTTLTFFKAKVEKLPNVSSLKCKSFYEYNGKQFPEIALYFKISLDDLPKYLYKGLAKLVVDNNIIEKAKNNDTVELNEGGTLFDNVTRINQENVQATLDDLFNTLLPMLKLNKDDVAVLGSTGKKLPGHSSGDIDIGIDLKKTSKTINAPDYAALRKVVEDKMKQLDIEVKAVPAVGDISFIWPIANVDRKQKDQFVQVDLLPVDDLDYIKWGQGSPHEKDEEWKSSVRNEILMSIASYSNRKTLNTVIVDGKEVITQYERYKFSPRDGLIKQVFSIEGKNGKLIKTPKKTSESLVTSDVRKLLKLMFNKDFKDLTPFKTTIGTWNELKKSDLWKDKELKDKILARTINELTRKNIPFPKEFTTELSDKSLLRESLLCEGGNAVEDVDRINRANVEATVKSVLDKVLPLIKIDPKDTAVLGSAGKKSTSGDIDIGIDKITDIKKFIDNAVKVLKQNDIECNPLYGFNTLSIKWPISNVDGKQAGKFVQIDLMPSDNIEMMKWGMYSPDEKDYKYKGTVRNELLNAIATYVDPKVLKTYVGDDGKEKILELERYAYAPQIGLTRIVRSIQGKSEGKYLKNPKTIKRTLISDDPKKIVKILFGQSAVPEKILTGDDVWKLFEKMDIYKDKDTRDQIIAKFLNGLKYKSVDYPKYMEDALSNTSLLESANTRIIIDKFIKTLFK